MTDTKHTPGPWFVMDYDDNVHQVAISDETATRYLAVIDNSDETDQANARLIAAAPELLEALANTRASLQEYFGDEDWDCSEIDAAITKATAP